jgi:ferrous iron transport protein B
MPCIAAFAAMKREMNSWKWTLIAVTYQTTVAWLVAFAIYQGGMLLGLR